MNDHKALELIPTDMERLVIGQILYSKDVISRAGRILKPEHFGDERCRVIYATCQELWRNDVGVDLLTVYYEMKKNGTCEPGQRAYDLATYTYPVAQISNFEEHAAVVLDHYRRRTLLTASSTLLHGIEDRTDTADVISQMNADIEAATIANQETDVSGAEVAYDVMNNPNKPKPLFLGMGKLDDFVFLLPGNMITIKGDAGSGKTAFVLSAVLNLLPKVSPWIVSLEMSETELMTRALCQLAETDIDLALKGELSDPDKERMAMCANHYGDILDRLRIEPVESMSLDEYRSKAEHMVKRRGVGLIVLDYAQLMDADHKRYPTQTQQLEAISKGIRATARRLNVITIVVVHISKDGTEHGTKQFEKDAHVRLAIEADATGARFVSALKNRNGRTCSQIALVSKMRHGMVGREVPPAWAPSRINPIQRRSPDEPNEILPF